MPAWTERLVIAILLAGASRVFANTPPVVDTFTATPAVPAPGQSVTLLIAAHDPDCAAACSSGCGATIRSDLLLWRDDTGRTPSPFQASSPSATGSPWNATVTWIAPPAEGTYVVSAQISDSGGMLCGGRLTRIASLAITVTNSRPPVIETFTTTPQSVPVGGEVRLNVSARDPLGRALTYSFAADTGVIAHAGPADPVARWTAPSSAGTATIRCTVTPAGGPLVSAQVNVGIEIGTFLRAISIADVRPTRAAPLFDGRVVVVDGASGTLAAVSAAGGQVSWRRSSLATPVAVAAMLDEIYVLERGANRVSVWSARGDRLRDFAIEAALPNDLTTGPNPGELAISDSEAARVLVVSAADGRILRTIGDGQLRFPAGIASNATRLAVADAGLARVLIFDAAGALVTTIGDDTLFIRPQGVAWDGAAHRLAVCDSYSGEITLAGEEGGVRGTIGGFGSEGGRLVNPIGAAMMSGGMLAVTTGGGDVSLFQLLATLPPLAPPANVTAADEPNDDGGSIALAWSASSDDPVRVRGYRVERATGESGQFEPVGSTGASVTQWIDRSAIDAVCHRYRVVATDGTLDAASAETPCTTARNDLPPPRPGSLVADVQSPFSMSVAWTAVPVRDLGGYEIEISTAGAAPRSIRTAASAISVSVTDLSPDRAYTISVRAFDTAANLSAALSTSVTTYPDVPPPSPVISVSDTATGGTAEVRWTSAVARVPVSNYRIVATPQTAGWPVVTNEWSTSPYRIRGLVNTLAYVVVVVALTPWGRGSDPSSPVRVVPTAPPLALPVIEAAGWDGTSGIEDAAGFDAAFEITDEKRVLRFRYRAAGTQLRLLVDGDAIAKPLDDTAGAWVDASVEVEKKYLKKTPQHLLALRNLAFPNPAAQLAVRQLDFVPLAPNDLKSDSFNTVVDLYWNWQEARRDLTATLFRSPDKKDGTWIEVTCRAPRSGRCRDAFRPNGEKFAYRLSIASPAGWTSESREIWGTAKYDDLPPEVTDVVVEPDFFPDGSAALKLSWTPLSSAASRNAGPEPVAGYRIYRSEAGRLTELGEAAGPPALIAAALFDPQKHALVIRSVDAMGRESR